MPILLEELIQQVPVETEEKVKKAKEAFNARIREALRRETRLSLQRHDGTNVAVPIRVVPGLPEPLIPRDKQSIEDTYRLSLLLAPYRQALISLRESGQTMANQLLPILRSDQLARSLLDGREISLMPAWQYADFLLKKLNEFELTKFILAINEDVLGVYQYKLRSGAAYDEPEPRIDLYWGVIGLIARDLAIDVEDLACVVLAHELAHAYTHVGADADDHFWKTREFADSDHELKEGLAQFYSLLICRRLADTNAGPLRAFTALLPKQPDAYHAHEAWIDSTPEHIRLAMLEARRHGPRGPCKRSNAIARLHTTNYRRREATLRACKKRGTYGCLRSPG